MEQKQLGTLDEVIKNTREALIEMDIENKSITENDLSYITQELIDDYRKNAIDKDENLVQSEIEKMKSSKSGEDTPCYLGNNWTLINANEWSYTNNFSGTGCDPVTDSCRCGSGNRWKVKVTRIKKSTYGCSNGAKDPRIAWN